MKIKKNFPSNVEIKRIQTLRKYERLNENDQESIFGLHDIIKKQYSKLTDIVYLAHAIPSRINEFYGDFVQGDTDRMAINLIGGNDAEGKEVDAIIENNELIEEIYTYAYNQSQYGYEVLLGYLDDEQNFKIQSVPKDQYFPQADGTVIFATYIFDPSDTSENTKDRKKLLYTQNYELAGKDVKIERRLWELDGDGKADIAVDLSKANISVDAEETISDLGVLPIVQIDNGKKTKWGFGRSDYADIMPQLQEVNERRTHISTQLLKNLDAKMQLPVLEELRTEDGKLKPFDYLMTDGEQGEAKYITNTNALIEDTEKHVEKNLQFISWTSAIPMFELLKSNMPERVESMRIQLFSSERKTNRKRSRITKGLQNIIKIGYKMKNSADLTGAIEIKYSDVLPTDSLVEVEEETAKIDGGLSSKRSAMKRLENFTDAEVDAEIELIKQEGIASGAVDPNRPPTF
jgi:hypothetical protein